MNDLKIWSGIALLILWIVKAYHYKIIVYGSNKEVLIAFSKDGIHWREFGNGIFKSSDTMTWTRNPYNGEYMIFFKKLLT